MPMLINVVAMLRLVPNIKKILFPFRSLAGGGDSKKEIVSAQQSLSITGCQVSPFPLSAYAKISRTMIF